MQKGNLKSHVNAIQLVLSIRISFPWLMVFSSSSGPQYPCPECNRRFSDAAARVRHRKKIHGYVPHHTKEYLARKTSNRKERIVQGTNNAVSTEVPLQSVTHAATDGFPDASPCIPPFKLPEVGYHDDYWKLPVDLARSYFPDSEPQPQRSQDAPIFLPVATVPGYDTPNFIQSFSMQPAAPLQPFLTPSEFTTINYSDYLDPQFDAMLPQGPSFGELISEDCGVSLYDGWIDTLPQY